MKSRIFSFVLVSPIIVFAAANANAQVLLSQYDFNGNLNDSSAPIAENGMTARDGIFREATVAATAEFTTGVDGVPGNAIQLDGIDDWIDLSTDGLPSSQTPSNLSLTRGPGIVSGTVTAWVKTSAVPEEGEQRWLMGSSNNEDTQSFRFGWNGTGLESAARPSDLSDAFTVFDDTADENVDNARWANGDWHHVAIAWRASSTFGTVYIDGAEVATPDNSGVFFNRLNAQTPWEFAMAIGAHNNAGTLEGFWEGAIDDLRIYADSLSGSQIQDVINEVDVAVTPDFDTDLDVDGNDFLTWQRGFGTGTAFSQGDANSTGSVDEVDLAIWQGFYGTVIPSPPAALQSVPEPTSSALLVLSAMLGMAARRHR